MFKYLMIGFLAVFGLEASTEEALKAFKNRDYKTAFKLYEKSALDGDSKAQSALSYLYSNGLGTEK
ncbi:MAG: sel1 repeat family protein, partial [Sulfurimonadaceae bacterium]